MYKIKFKVRFSDVCQRGLVKPINMVKFLQDCEMYHIDSLEVFNQYLQQNKVGIFLTFRQIDFHKPLKFKDEIKVITSPYETKSFLGYRNTVIYDEFDQIVTTSYSLGNFVTMQDAKPHRIPVDIIKAVGISDRVEMDYTDRKVIKDESFVRVKSFKQMVLRADIDLYDHVNNTRYVDFVHNFLPDEFEFNRIRAEYKYPLKLGDMAYINLYYKDNMYLGEIFNQDQQLCAMIEFSTK